MSSGSCCLLRPIENMLPLFRLITRRVILTRLMFRGIILLIVILLSRALRVNMVFLILILKKVILLPSITVAKIFRFILNSLAFLIILARHMIFITPILFARRGARVLLILIKVRLMGRRLKKLVRTSRRPIVLIMMAPPVLSLIVPAPRLSRGTFLWHTVMVVKFVFLQTPVILRVVQKP